MKNILLVEDDRAVALAVVYGLKKEGFNVIHAKNLREGRREIKGEIALVLLDLMLPDGDGYEFCTEIREAENEVPIIFMTACDEDENVILGLDLGADDYISKPVKIKVLTSRIKAVLRRKGVDIKEKQSILKSGDVEVNISSHIVKINKEEINITLSEFKLLVILMENAPNVMTRGIILERLWDVEGNFIEDNALSVYMKRLREKIEENSSAPKYIQTVRGVGYKWAIEVVKK